MVLSCVVDRNYGWLGLLLLAAAHIPLANGQQGTSS